MNIHKIKDYLARHSLPPYRFKQIIKSFYQEGAASFSDITTLPKDLREDMDNELNVLLFKVEKVSASRDKKSIKALLKLPDGNKIETVLLRPVRDYWSACISSQVGCALGCRFCATGSGGFKRNLSSEEICDQVLFWKQYLVKENLEGSFSSVVFMGMGEPFMNYTDVAESLKNLLDSDLFNFASRHISVSTAGLPAGIKRLANEFPQVNLAISINTAADKERSKLMPINKEYNLKEIGKALDFYFSKTKRKVFLEYILFDRINDQQIDADNLIRFVRLSTRPDLLHINLIRYHRIRAAKFKSSKKDTAEWFKDYLLKNGIKASIRKSLGEEIDGACGQLVSHD